MLTAYDLRFLGVTSALVLHYVHHSTYHLFCVLQQTVTIWYKYIYRYCPLTAHSKTQIQILIGPHDCHNSKKIS